MMVLTVVGFETGMVSTPIKPVALEFLYSSQSQSLDPTPSTLVSRPHLTLTTLIATCYHGCYHSS